MIACLMLPGSVVGVVAAGGMVHNTAQWVVDATDLALYAALSYCLLTVLREN